MSKRIVSQNKSNHINVNFVGCEITEVERIEQKDKVK